MERENQPRSKIRKLSSEIRSLSSPENRRLPSSDHEYTTVTAPIFDRLSALPDDVICHILSFLPTKKSVQTSILAKRWRSMWARVPSLHFDRDDYRGNQNPMSSIIFWVMMLRTKGVNINTFSLFHKGNSCTSFEFETWIATLIAHNVQILNLCLNYQFDLPQCLFSCKTLVELRLRNCSALIDGCNAVQFPSLKKLLLDSVNYEAYSSLPNLISGCPVLEELILVLDGSRNGMISCLISSPTLNRLDIDSNFNYADQKWYEVKLNTPALTYLRLHDFVSNDFSPGALTSLTEANIYFCKRRGVLRSRPVLESVRRLCNVKCLSLSTSLLDDVDNSAFSLILTMTKFRNLTNLVLEGDWRFISFFLENAESLQVLDLRLVDGKIKHWMEPKRVPYCLTSHLRKVTISELGATAGEFELVRYLLRNAMVMKRMEIHNLNQEEDSDEESDAIERITNYLRGNEACELVFN